MNNMNCLVLMPRMRPESDAGEQYPFLLGVCYISAALKRDGSFPVHTINMNHVDEKCDIFLNNFIAEHNIRIVMTGGLCNLFWPIFEIFEAAKSASKDIVTIVGGGIITGDPEAALRALKYADYGVIGEGEETVVDLCHTIKNNVNIESVRGIVYLKDGRFHATEDRPPVADIDSLPWCDYSGFGFQQYLDQAVAISSEANRKWLTKPALSMLTSRSCPGRCTFCFHPEGKRYRVRDMRDVFRELDSLLAAYNTDLVYFVDEMIGLSIEKLKHFCEQIQKRNIPWITSFRVADINREKIQIIKKNGCKAIFLGIESGSNAILKSMNKGITVEQIENALEACKEEKLLAQGNILFGDPMDTYETCIESLEWYLAHPQYNINLVALSYYPGTQIYWEAVRRGKIQNREEYLKHSPMVINCSKMTDDEYNDIMFHKISQYRALRDKLLPEFKAIEKRHENNVTAITCECSRCNRKLHYDKISPLVHFDRPFLCEYCGELHLAPVSFPFSKLKGEELEKNLAGLSKEYGEIAFWGIRLFFQNVFDREIHLPDSVHLIDFGECGKYSGTVIESPQVILDGKIQLIILPPMGITSKGKDLADEIMKYARRLNRNIKFLHFNAL